MIRPDVAAAFALTIMLALPPLAADGDDTSARSAYEQAQTMKRANQFVQARTAFQGLAALPGSEPWSTLAADELRYGLPLHESRVLMARLSTASDSRSRNSLVQQIESLYRSMISDNADKPDRVAEIERSRDQLALLRQASSRNEAGQLKSGLIELREQLENDRQKNGRWPDRRGLEAAVVRMLGNAGISPDRLSLFDYYPTSNSFYASFRDPRGELEIKIKGNGTSVRIEGGGL